MIYPLPLLGHCFTCVSTALEISQTFLPQKGNLINSTQIHIKFWHSNCTSLNCYKCFLFSLVPIGQFMKENFIYVLMNFYQFVSVIWTIPFYIFLLSSWTKQTSVNRLKQKTTSENPVVSGQFGSYTELTNRLNIEYHVACFSIQTRF